jgi:UDP-3-O-[3-hydroxymyristoyl] glucosamine N-acyltransferase
LAATGDGETPLTSRKPESARPGDLVFLGQRNTGGLEETKASAAIVRPDETFRAIPVLIADDPQLACVRAVELFFAPYLPGPGIHPTAVVSGSAEIGPGVSIGALSVIGDGVRIGAGAVIFPLVSVYPRAVIGEGSVIHSHVSIREEVRSPQGPHPQRRRPRGRRVRYLPPRRHAQKDPQKGNGRHRGRR